MTGQRQVRDAEGWGAVNPGAESRLIEPATAAHWPDLWTIVEPIVRAGDTYALPRDLRAEEARDLWLAPPPSHTAVLRQDGHILATVRMGPNKPGPGSHIGTAAFMVAPAAHGRGIGRELGQYAVAWLRDRGYRGIQFNGVVQTNHAAVRLWQSLGFTIVGTVPDAFEHPEHGFVGLHIMFLPLVAG